MIHKGEESRVLGVSIDVPVVIGLPWVHGAVWHMMEIQGEKRGAE